jgi:putative phage-type endonuclease
MTSPSTSQSFSASDRQKYLGASEIAAVLGIDKWRTPLDIYNSKLGLVAPFEGNNHTERGNRLEAIAADYYTELTGRKLRRYTKAYAHKEHSFIQGHIDRIVEGESVIAEIKCPSIAAYRKIQREGLPDGWQIQMQVYMGLSGHKQCVIIVFCADAWDLLHFELEFDDAIYTPAILAGATFWNEHVVTQTPPNAEQSGKKTDIEFAKTDGTVTFRDDETFIAKSVALIEAIQLTADAEQLFEMAKKEYLEAIEDSPGIYECAGLRVHYNERPGRKTFDKKALAAKHPEIDLSDFEKVGNPYKEFRSYILNRQ